MKKLFLFALVSLSLLSSCSSSDSIDVTEEKLAKKWYYKSFQANGLTEPYEHLSCAKDYIQFLAGGSYVEFYITDCNPTASGTTTGNWVLDGSTVAITMSGESYQGKVTKLSDTDLQITITADYDDDGDEEKVRANFTSN